MSGEIVLIAEDDDILREFLALHLKKEGYVIREAAHGREALAVLCEGALDLALLDRDMPGIDGLEILRRARAEGVLTPAIFLTGVGAIEERVRGLDAGADDYIVKPFEVAELLARLRAAIRRPPPQGPQTAINAGRLCIDVTAWRARFDGAELALTAQDVSLLATFLKWPQKTFTRETLLAHLGASTEVSEAAVEHAISRLRKKLGQSGVADCIETVRGVGYRLDATVLG